MTSAATMRMAPCNLTACMSKALLATRQNARIPDPAPALTTRDGPDTGVSRLGVAKLYHRYPHQGEFWGSRGSGGFSLVPPSMPRTSGGTTPVAALSRLGRSGRGRDPAGCARGDGDTR